jgi:general secretion pathway protein G
MADVAVAISSLAAQIEHYKTERSAYPTTLADIGAASIVDPWGRPYQYVSHADSGNKGNWRKDHNINPINSDFDLWSNGKDGASSPQLTATASRDDIVRANDGRFIGLASQYDP